MLPKIVLSLFEKIVLVISKKFQKFFSIIRAIFFTIGQNNFGNKIPFS